MSEGFWCAKPLQALQGHGAADRLGLLGHENDSEAALANLLEQLVGSDLRAGALRDFPGDTASTTPSLNKKNTSPGSSVTARALGKSQS